MMFTINVRLNYIEMKGTLESGNPQRSQLQKKNYDHSYTLSIYVIGLLVVLHSLTFQFIINIPVLILLLLS